ncbi:MAG TPA: SAM-dependent methyltransferase, partial [Pyrinomonadaceae bacterium]
EDFPVNEGFLVNFDLAVVDVSFISITKILPAVVPLLRPNASLVVLIKPQFEVGRAEVGSGGIVRNEQKRLRVVAELNQFASTLELKVEGVIESPITGAEGNVEYLAHYSYHPASKHVDN